MSCFWDIWINNAGVNPIDKRIINNSWEQLDNNVSISKPISYSKEYYQHYQTDTHTLVMCGQFYEDVLLDKLLQHCINYSLQKEKQFNDPTGHYILFITDKKSKACHVFTNRLGTYHAYYQQSPTQNIISTYWLGLAQQSSNKKLDWEGITNFFSNGYFPSDKTYLESIRIFEPGSYYHFDASLKLVGKERYYNWEYQPVTGSVSDIINELDSTLKTIVSYTANNTVVSLPISGGLDSRMLAGILSESKESTRDIWSYSYGYDKRSKEIEIAAKVAGKAGLSFSGYTVPNYLFNEMDIISDSVELFQYVDGTRQAFMRSKLEHDADIVIGGHWGDVWMDSIYIESYKNLDDYYNKKIIKRGSKWLLDNICSSRVSSTKDIIENNLRSSFEKYNYIDDIDFRIKAWKTDTWSFRWTLASIRMYQAGTMPVLPFYDKRFVDLISKIPSHYHKDRKLQIEFIKKQYPQLAKIEWQKYGSNLYWYKYFNNKNILYRIGNKAKPTLTGNKKIQRNWEVFYLNPDGKQKLTNVLLNESNLTDYVSKEKIDQLLADFYNYPSGANGYTISMLHTFAQFLKRMN